MSKHLNDNIQTTLNVQTSQRQHPNNIKCPNMSTTTSKQHQMSKHLNDNIQTTLNVQTCQRQHPNNTKCPNISTTTSKQH